MEVGGDQPSGWSQDVGLLFRFVPPASIILIKCLLTISICISWPKVDLWQPGELAMEDLQLLWEAPHPLFVSPVLKSLIFSHLCFPCRWTLHNMSRTIVHTAASSAPSRHNNPLCPKIICQRHWPPIIGSPAIITNTDSVLRFCPTLWLLPRRFLLRGSYFFAVDYKSIKKKKKNQNNTCCNANHQTSYCYFWMLPFN